MIAKNPQTVRSLKELRDMVETIPEGTVISMELTVEESDGEDERE